MTTEVQTEEIDTTPPPPPEKDKEPRVKVLMRKAKAELDDAKEDKEEKKEEDVDKEESEGGRKPQFSKVLMGLQRADQLETKAWIDQLAAETAIRVQVIRREPKFITDSRTGERKKVDGTLQTYDRTISEEEIQENHGGGLYQLVIKVRNEKGNFVYFAARTVNIAGDPRLDDVPRTGALPLATQQAAPQADPLTSNLMGKAFDFMANQANQANRMPASTSSSDIAHAIASATAPFKIQIDALTRMLENKDHEIVAIREQAAKGDPYKDKLLDKMIDGDSARLNAVRMQYESEIRMLKEQQVASENRIRDQHQRDLDLIERRHEREIGSLRQSFEREVASAGTASSTQKMVLDAELRRLERELDNTKAELVTLRAKKEQSIKDKVEEMKGLKELLGDGDDDGDEDKSTLVKVLEAAGNLPVVAQLANRFGGGEQGAAPAGNPQQQQAPAQPRKLVRNKLTGAVMARGPQGQLTPVNRVVPPSESNPQAVVPPVDPAMIKQAIEYMEGAFRSGTDPDSFADSARPMIPASVLGAIRALGIDDFMVKVAQLDGTSPLATQGGRNWRRKVANRLLGEADE